HGMPCRGFEFSQTNTCLAIADTFDYSTTRREGAAFSLRSKDRILHAAIRMRRPIWLSAVALAVTGLVAAGCSSSGSSSSTSGSSTAAAGSTSAAAAGSVFGTPKKATGSPYVFGMINDETGAVTFPEARQGA